MAAALGVALLAGCGQSDNGLSIFTSPAAGTVSASIISASETVSSVDVSFDSSDAYFNWKSGVYTTLDMSEGTQSITKSGIYEITGTVSDGSLIVDVDKSADDGTVTLVLNNSSITSATGAPIYVKYAKKVVVMLENGTTNTLSQGSGVSVNSDNEPTAALFSKADLTITGGGTLNVTSDYNDGISCRDTLKITDGTLVVNAVGDGIIGKDVLAVENGSITVATGKDGMRATNDTDAGMGSILLKDGTFNVTSANDAIQAVGVLQIDGGTYHLTTGGGYSGSIKSNSNFGGGMKGGQFPQRNTDATTPAAQTMPAGSDATSTSAGASDTTAESSKCLKADGGILINGGDITASSYEDALHSKGAINIAGGTLTLTAGDKGIQADSGVAITGGTLDIQNSYEGIEGKNITVTGGDIKLTSSDDGFNVNDASGLLTIGGGTVYINAGGDGLDSNGSISMTGGTVTVDGPTDNGNGALDSYAGFTISGGSIVATGSSGMAEVPDSDSGQASILMYYSGTQAAGSAVTLKDASGAIVATFTPSKAFSSAAISAPELVVGQTFTIYSNDKEIVTFTLTDTITYLNESGVMTNPSMGTGGQPGGFHGGGQPGGTKPGFNQPPGGQAPGSNA